MTKSNWFVRGDIDGFFGLLLDNLIQLLVLIGLCIGVCGFPPLFVFGTVLPGATISLLFGNLFYAFQARKLALKENRDDVTALPYGINTVSLFAFIFFVILPVYIKTGDYKFICPCGNCYYIYLYGFYYSNLSQSICCLYSAWHYTTAILRKSTVSIQYSSRIALCDTWLGYCMDI